MKQYKFTRMLLTATLVTLLVSCGGDKKDPESEPDVVTKPAPSVPVNTIVTTPQDMIVIKHKVADFAKWKDAYTSHDSARLANGLHSYVIGRGMQDSTIVLVALKADDIAKAKSFTKDPSLQQAMKKGGVIGKPEIAFTTITWQDTANVGNFPRVITTYSVKNWDAWKIAFEEGKKERVDNGIIDRQYGHDADDTKKISLVTALSDTAKAHAYYTSDAIKKRREAAGVTTEPVRFQFNIVQRY